MNPSNQHAKTIDPREPVSKVESKTLDRRKGTLQAFSRGSDVDELVLLVFGGCMLGMVFLSHGWIHAVSKGVSLNDRFIAHRLDELKVSQRMLPWAFRLC